MLTSVMIERRTGGGKYGNVLDAAELLAAGDYSSAANAVVVMARQSPLFRETMEKLRGAQEPSIEPPPNNE